MGKCTWLYILSDHEEEYFYVGMTYRLFTRLREHLSGKGAVATQTWEYDTLQAVYKIDTERQHDQGLENELTLKLMKGQGEAWWKVRGGVWCQTTKRDKPQELVNMKHFPEMCKCHYPVAEKLSKSGRQYAACARKDVDWVKEEMLHGSSSCIPCFTAEECDYFRWMDE